MAGTTGRTMVGRRILMGFDENVKFAGATTSFADIDFGCFEEEDVGSSPGSSYNDIDEEDEEMSQEKIAESKAFWDDQYELLHTNLSRTTSMESRIREVTREVLNEFKLTGGGICFCSKPVIGGCQNCTMRKICDRLQNAGFDSGICRSKWRRSQDIPAGEHTYMDVIEKSSSNKKGDIRVVIELGFRAEFEMGRASGEYNKMINRLPEVFVGKAERLKTAIKMLCSAAKKCMKENKMHMGPWRKHKYMQAKWFSPCQRTTFSEILLPTLFSDRFLSVKPKSSMLSFDLEDKLPSSFQPFTAVVAVV